MHVTAIQDLQLLLSEIHRIDLAIANVAHHLARKAPKDMADQLEVLAAAAECAADKASAATQTTQ